MKKYFLYITLFALIFSSCDLKEDYEIERSKVVEAAGQWYVNYSTDAGYESGYVLLKTFNTSADDGQAFWITDEGEWWDYKVKSPINIDALTFGGADLENTAYDIKIQVLNGKVITGGGKSTSGVVTDSIYFELEFEDDPGTIYKAAGHRRTGFLEDEH